MKHQFLVCLLFFLVGCNHDSEKNEKVVLMQFNVDKSLIEKGFSNSLQHITIGYPKGFEIITLDSSKINLIKKKDIEINVISKKNNVLFAIFNLSKTSDSTFNVYTSNKANAQSFFMQDTSSITTSIDSFQSNGFYFKQYIYRDNTNILFKAIVKNSYQAKYEVNFILPINEYANYSRTIESVLGSIK
jgi:hypothetical protein